MGWERSGKSWGARARDWATYQEDLGSNAISAVLAHTGVGPGTKLLDIACGSGLALARAVAAGAECAGVDASEALLDIARQRTPRAYFVRSPMEALPFEDESFDVVTSFNGLQFGGDGTFPEAVRVLNPGGVLAMSFWSDFGDFTEYSALIQNFSHPGGPKLPAQFMKPGVAEKKFEELGLDAIERINTEVFSLYDNIDDAYKGLASAGPAVIAIDYSGEVEVRIALEEYLNRFTDSDSGRIKLTGTFASVFGRKP